MWLNVQEVGEWPFVGGPIDWGVCHLGDMEYVAGVMPAQGAIGKLVLVVASRLINDSQKMWSAEPVIPPAVLERFQHYNFRLPHSHDEWRDYVVPFVAAADVGHEPPPADAATADAARPPRLFSIDPGHAQFTSSKSS